VRKDCGDGSGSLFCPFLFPIATESGLLCVLRANIIQKAWVGAYLATLHVDCMCCEGAHSVSWVSVLVGFDNQELGY
jgi:hypothetical protein